MTRQLIMLLLILSGILTKSFSQGIAFKTDASWAEIKRQAKIEKKYIFMDIGATFCAPCHKMEKEVFTKDSVAQFYNKNFINVRIQADKTAHDNDEVKSWYADVQQILKQNNVGAYPSYLFFSPEGKLVYRYVGTALPNEFIVLGVSALDPNLGVNKRIEDFKNHKMNLADEGELASFLQQQEKAKEASIVATHYKVNYLNKVDDSVLKIRSNLNFISGFPFLLVPGDRYFKLFYNHGPEMDSLTWKGHSYHLTNRIITIAEIWNKVYVTGTKKIKEPNPDWEKIRNTIVTKYSAERADKILPVEKYRFYNEAMNWPHVIETGNELIENSAFNTSVPYADLMNQIAYNAFEHGRNRKDVVPSLKWAEKYLKNVPDNFSVRNTYSCLLYKLGETQKAIDEGERSIELLKQNVEREDMETMLPAYEENLRKMKNRAPSGELKRTVDKNIPI